MGCYMVLQRSEVEPWSVVAWWECHPVHQKVGLIPSQGTYLGWGFSPLSRYVWQATNLCFSLPSSKINFKKK